MEKLPALAVLLLTVIACEAPAKKDKPNGAPEFWNPVDEARFQPEERDPPPVAGTYEEELLFQPGINLYRIAGALTDLFGTKGSQLCAPVSITHGFAYLKQFPDYGNLQNVGDRDGDGSSDSYSDRIRYFFDICGTDREIGTRYHQAIGCMRRYIEDSGYASYAYIFGPHSPEAPPGQPIESTRHLLSVDDIRASVGNRLLVLMGIGWYRYDEASATYLREGGHFFNLYGYDYETAWGQERIRLKVVNSWSSYEGRAPEESFDVAEMTRLPRDGTGYPAETAYELRGTGFDFATHRALVEDIFVALPLTN
jgi:hypothetical protein